MHACDDPAGAWWSIRAIVSISVAAALLALWFRLPAYVFISGLLLNVAGMVGWHGLGTDDARRSLVADQCALPGCRLGRLVAAGGGAQRRAFRTGKFNAGRCRSPIWRPLAAVGLLAALVAAGVAAELFAAAELRLEIGRMDWIALGAAAVAVAVCLWDRKARFVLAGLYFLGLSAAGMALCAAGLEPRIGCWWAASALPAFALAAAALGWLLPRIKPVGRLLRMPDAPGRVGRWNGSCSPGGSACRLRRAGRVGLARRRLSTAIGGQAACCGLAGRLAGGLGGLLLLGAAVVMAAQARGPWRSLLAICVAGGGRVAAGLLGLGKARSDRRHADRRRPLAPPQRDSDGRRRPACCCWADSGWDGCCRQRAIGSPPVGGWRPSWAASSLLALVAVLVQERMLFDPAAVSAEAEAAPVPMVSPWIAPWAVAVVAAALRGPGRRLPGLRLGAAMGPAAAERPRPDGVRLCGRGAAGADLGLHLRITCRGCSAAPHPDLLDADRDGGGVLRGGPERPVPSPQDAGPLGAAGTDGPAAADLAADRLLVPRRAMPARVCGSWAIPARRSGC